MTLNFQSETFVETMRASSRQLQSAILREDPESSFAALRCGANPALDKGRALTLGCASADQAWRHRIVAELLRAGASDRATGGDALCLAVLAEDATLVSMLVASGADVCAGSNRALRLALDRGYLAVADKLLLAGANLRDAPAGRQSALDLAFTSKHWAVTIPWVAGKL